MWQCVRCGQENLGEDAECITCGGLKIEVARELRPTRGSDSPGKIEARSASRPSTRAPRKGAPTPKPGSPPARPVPPPSPVVVPIAGLARSKPAVEKTDTSGSAGPPSSSSPRRRSTSALPWIVVAGCAALAAAVVVLVLPRSVPKPPYPIQSFTKPIIESVAAPGLNVRKGPGSTYPLAVEQPLENGTAVTVYGEAQAADGGHWVYAQISPSIFGYINAKYLAGPSTSVISTQAAPIPALSTPSATFAPSDGQLTARRRALAYFAIWSGPNSSITAELPPYYSSTVTFYGTRLSRDAVMTQKLHFIQRWPIRSYVVRAESLATTCNAQTCTAEGLLAWRNLPSCSTAE